MSVMQAPSEPISASAAATGKGSASRRAMAICAFSDPRAAASTSSAAGEELAAFEHDRGRLSAERHEPGDEMTRRLDGAGDRLRERAMHARRGIVEHDGERDLGLVALLGIHRCEQEGARERARGVGARAGGRDARPGEEAPHDHEFSSPAPGTSEIAAAARPRSRPRKVVFGLGRRSRAKGRGGKAFQRLLPEALARASRSDPRERSCDAKEASFELSSFRRMAMRRFAPREHRVLW